MKKSIVTLFMFVVISIISTSSANAFVTDGFECPCTLSTAFSNNTIVLIDRNGQIIKQYPEATHRDNRRVELYNRRIYCMRSDYSVYVYDVDSGAIQGHYNCRGAKNWIRDGF